MKIKQDEYGLSVQADGYTARPAVPSRYKVGDDVKTHHYSGSINVGVGKDEHSCRGKYVELWFVGPSNKPFGKKPSSQEVADDITYHKARFLQSTNVIACQRTLTGDNHMETQLKLFVWNEFNPDYSFGLAFAIAENEAEARELVEKGRGYEVDSWGPVQVFEANKKHADSVSGGA